MIKISECYILIYHFLIFIFCPRQIRSLSSVSSVENDKHLVILEINGPEIENLIEVLHITFSIVETQTHAQTHMHVCTYTVVYLVVVLLVRISKPSFLSPYQLVWFLCS